MTTQAEAEHKANQVFTKPGLRDRVQVTLDGFTEPGQDGHSLVAMLRDALVEQGEYDFEQEVAPYLYVVQIPKKHFTSGKYHLNRAGEPSPLFQEAQVWLFNKVPHDEYLAFPTTAVGKYKDCCFNVYFKTAQWATYFKVGFIY